VEPAGAGGHLTAVEQAGEHIAPVRPVSQVLLSGGARACVWVLVGARERSGGGVEELPHAMKVRLQNRDTRREGPDAG
jgi:hypothetical protein